MLLWKKSLAKVRLARGIFAECTRAVVLAKITKRGQKRPLDTPKRMIER